MQTPFYNEEKIDEMAEMLGITHILLQQTVKCSYGEQQRIAIIRALMQPFELLLLDEPFSHLDNENTKKAVQLIAQECAARNAGTGNVATVLAKLLYSKQHIIQQVYGRNVDTATVLANEVNAVAINNLKDLKDDCDVIIIAVSDKSITAICNEIKVTNAILLHTAGSVSIEVLQQSSLNYGVLYPIQSLRKSMDILTPIPFLIDGNNDVVKSKIETLAKSISNKVEVGNDDKRLKLHTAAIFACNFVNYMYLQSASFCEASEIDFSLLQALIEETATRLRTHHPKEVFTGPALQIYINVMRWAGIEEIYVPKIGLADGLIQHLYDEITGS
ncbi:unnamed protein product [Rotaria sp. Silwood1]|nr:unnamed protein product [Rotaria sp. Silwood1]CAF4577030.1 unnamed protein product [Rotaria sp. Silwood1]